MQEANFIPAEVCDRPDVIDDAARTVAKIRYIVTDAAEEGVRSARQAVQQGRYAVEDAIDGVHLTVRRKPFESMGLVFAAGLLAGGFLGWIGTRRR